MEKESNKFVYQWSTLKKCDKVQKQMNFELQIAAKQFLATDHP